MKQKARDEIIEIILDALTDTVKNEVSKALDERDYELNKADDEAREIGLRAFRDRYGNINTRKPIMGTLW